jgi:oligosaccharide repeat unit polymerase
MTINRCYAMLLLSMIAAIQVINLFFSTSNIVWIFVTLYWIIGIPFIIYLQKIYDDILHPVISLLIIVFLYATGSVIYYNNTGVTLFGDPISEKSVILFIAACFLGELGIILGAMISVRNEIRGVARSVLPHSIITRWILVMLILAFILPLISFNKIFLRFNFFQASAYSEWALSSRISMMDADATWPILQVLAVETPMILLLASGIFLLFREHYILRFIGGVILAGNILTSLLSGSRGGMFGTLCAIFIFIHYRIKKWRLSVIALGIVLSLFLLNGISVVRSTSKPSDMYDILVYETDGNVISLINLGSSGEFLVGLNLMKLIEAISSGETKLNYGKGFLDDITCYIPRAIFPNRPLPLSERFVEEFYPGVREGGGGYGLFFLQDGYWAFGLMGVLISMVLYSCAISNIYMYFKNYFESDFMVLMYSFIYFPLVISSPRSGLLISLKSALMSSIPFIIVIVVSSLVSMLKKNYPIKYDSILSPPC